MNPTFDNEPLTSLAAAEVVGAPAVRTGRHHMPDVQGEYFQVVPVGGREITVGGVLTSAISTGADLAVKDLKLRIRIIQELLGQVGTYVGADGTVWSEAMFREYRQTGPIESSRRHNGIEALVNVEALVITQP